MRRLRDKARLTLSEFRPERAHHSSSRQEDATYSLSRESPSTSNGGRTDVASSIDINELMILRGVTRLIEQQSSTAIDSLRSPRHILSIPEETNNSSTAPGRTRKAPDKSTPRQGSPTDAQKTYTELALAYLSESMRAPQHLNPTSANEPNPRIEDTRAVSSAFSFYELLESSHEKPHLGDDSLAAGLASTSSSVSSSMQQDSMYLPSSFDQLGLSADCGLTKSSSKTREQLEIQQGADASGIASFSDDSSNLPVHRRISDLLRLGIFSNPNSSPSSHIHPGSMAPLPTPKSDMGLENLFPRLLHSSSLWDNSIPTSNDNLENHANIPPLSEFHPSLHSFSQSDINTIMSFPVVFTPVVENVAGSSDFFHAVPDHESKSNFISNTDWMNFMENEGIMDLDGAD